MGCTKNHMKYIVAHPRCWSNTMRDISTTMIHDTYASALEAPSPFLNRLLDGSGVFGSFFPFFLIFTFLLSLYIV